MKPHIKKGKRKRNANTDGDGEIIENMFGLPSVTLISFRVNKFANYFLSSIDKYLIIQSFVMRMLIDNVQK